MKYVYENSLELGAPFAEPPAGAITIAPHMHQKAVLYAMDNLERALQAGINCGKETFHSTYGILGDAVGVGKSLMVMGHVARAMALPPEEDPVNAHLSISSASIGTTFSIRRQALGGPNEAGCILIVPHTLYRQWAQYIKTQSTLKALYLERRKALADEGLRAAVLGAQLVLISNTLYKEFSGWQASEGITWRRAFIDEADTIPMTGGYYLPSARFTWLITASWKNLLFPNMTLHLSNLDLQNVIFTGTRYAPLQPYFAEAHRTNKPYNYFRFNVTAYNFIRSVVSADHAQRGRLVVRCSENFVRESIALPPLTRTNVYCRGSAQAMAVMGSVSPEVQQLLHAGDTAGAIQALGLKAEDADSIAEAVTKRLRLDLEKMKALYEAKRVMVYSTPGAKEAALATLKEKITAAEHSLAALTTRIEGLKDETCPICYEDPGAAALLTPCCSRVFCGACILHCLSRGKSAACPMCRETITAGALKHVVSKEQANAIVEAGAAGAAAAAEPEPLPKKHEALLRIFQENPAAKFLVFSRFDNPFTDIEAQLAALGIGVKQMKGNKDAVANTLRAFQGGAVRCLLLNSQYAGSGLNITAATHVILWHAMTHEEEKQILGRAYRLGRTEPMQFIRLLHENEATNAAI